MKNTKYQPLTEYLLKSNKDEITLSFSEIEAILGFTLPGSAKNYAVNWSNTKSVGLPWAWLNAGYKTHNTDMKKGIVHFTKIGLLEELKTPNKTAKAKTNMRTYVIARMYAGSYLNEKLGGEAINLLHDDNGNNYIFVGPYGFIDKKYDDTVEGIILTRLTKAGCFEILGITKTSKDSQVTYQNGPTLKKRFENARTHLTEYAHKNNIKYGGVYLRDINNGAFFGADITFKSDELLLPNEDIFITDDHNTDYKVEGSKVFNLCDKRFPNQSLHCYVTNIENPNSFKQIEKLIKMDELWDKGRINKIEDNKVIDKHFNYLDVIRKEYDALVYSNLFSYIFKTYPEVFVDFANKVLGLTISAPYSIERERANIDLWIEDENNILVIENKIKSGINGVSARHDFSEGGLIQSQLLKYFNYAEKEKDNKRTSYFIFVPNYNKIDLKQYSGSKNYKEIKYSELFNYFSKVSIEDVYFKEFVNSLYRHTKDREVDYAEDMALKFLNQIKRNKQNV